MGRRKGSLNKIRYRGIIYGKLCPHCHNYFTEGYPLRKYCPVCKVKAKGEKYCAIISLRESNPCLTLQAIGTKVGLTRERVRQILEMACLHTKHYVRKNICLNCGTEYNPQRYNSLFCSRKCHHEYTHPFIECSVCGTLFRRNAKGLTNQISHGELKTHLFCSKQCQGKFTGTHYNKNVYKKLVPTN